jgi:hypothetical protein
MEEKLLLEYSKWFNENQWRGDKGDKLKAAFCKCDYKYLVQEFLKQKIT